jgi:hypothetical protein
MPSKAIGSAVVVHGKVCPEFCQKGLSTAGTQTLKHLAAAAAGEVVVAEDERLGQVHGELGELLPRHGDVERVHDGQVAAVPGLHDGTQPLAEVRDVARRVDASGARLCRAGRRT